MAKAIPFHVFGTNEAITSAILNQIAENADPRRDIAVLQSNTNIGANLTTSATLTLNPDSVVSLTTRTGRVLITASFAALENLAAAATYDFTFFWGTTATPATNVAGSGAIMSHSSAASSNNSISMSWLLSGLTPGTLYYVGIAAGRAAGTGRFRISRGHIFLQDV